MRLEEALVESNMGAAKRPFYNMPVDPEIDKVIISIGQLEYVYVAHALSGRPVKYMNEADISDWKIYGREDWEPINVQIVQVEEKNDKDNTESSSAGPETGTEPSSSPVD